MNDRTAPRRPVSIGIAERDTGLSKDTLRVWERRYGFPVPIRDPAGERWYPPEQIEKLRLMRHLLDTGRRPGRIVSLSIAELQMLVQGNQGFEQGADRLSAALATYLDLLKGHDAVALGRQLDQACMHMGLARFIKELVAPLATQIGDAWMRGRLAIFEEHIFSEAIQRVLRAANARLPEPGADARPRVLLTTFVGEPHGLGLLMAEGLLALEGARCTSLGVLTPIWDIAQAARAFRSDVVALGFAGAMNPNQMVEGLTELRSQLPGPVELWAGGSAPALHRREIAGVIPIAALSQLHAHVERWRGGASS